MKHLNYLLMLLVSVFAMSCGDNKVSIKEIETTYADIYGDHTWAIRYVGSPLQIAIIPSDECDTLYNIEATIALECAEKVTLPESMIAEFKKASLYVYQAYEVDEMGITAEGAQRLTKLLSGKAGKSDDITFRSKKSYGRTFIDKEFAPCDNFRIGDCSFTKKGKVSSKDLFNAYFGDADLNSIITQCETELITLRRAFDAYEESDSKGDRVKLIEALRVVQSYCEKIEESCDEDDLTGKQIKRLHEIAKKYNDIESDFI